MAKTKPTSGATRLADLATGKTDQFKLDPAIIVIEEGFNYRDYKRPQNKEHIKNLKESIRVHGVLQPLWVRFDPETKVPILIDGESRLRAVRELIAEGVEILTVPVTQKKDIGEAERIILSLTANGSKPPSQWEVGGAYKRLLNYGWTEEQIAEKMGQTVDYVKGAIELSATDTTTKKLLDEAAVTPAAARWAVKHHGDKHSLVIVEAVKRAREKHEAKKAAKEAKGGKKAGRKPKEDKPEPVKRIKAKGGRFIKDDVLALITKALEAAEKSDDVEIQLSAESALEALNDKE